MRIDEFIDRYSDKEQSEKPVVDDIPPPCPPPEPFTIGHLFQVIGDWYAGLMTMLFRLILFMFFMCVIASIFTGGCYAT